VTGDQGQGSKIEVTASCYSLTIKGL